MQLVTLQTWCEHVGRAQVLGPSCLTFHLTKSSAAFESSSALWPRLGSPSWMNCETAKSES